MDSKELENLNSLLETYLSEIEKNNNKVILINSNSVSFLKDNKKNILKQKTGNIKFKYFDASEGTMVPFFPFIDIVSDMVRELDEKEMVKFLKSRGVYNSHIKIFRDYFIDGIAGREEDLLREEIFFEKNRMKQNFNKIIFNSESDYFNGINIILIENGDKLSETVLEMLEEIGEIKNGGKNIFIVSYKNSTFASENIIWEDFLKRTENKIYNMALETSVAGNLAKNKKNSDVEILDAAVNCYYFFNVNEAAVLIRKFEENINGINIEKENDTYEKYLLIGGFIYQYKGEYDRADSYFQRYLNYSLKINNYLKISNAYRLIGLMHNEKGNYEDGLKSAYMAMSFLENKKYSMDLKCKIEFIKIEALSELRFKYPEEFKKSFLDGIDDFIKFKMYNKYLVLMGRALTSDYIYNSFPATLKKCDEAIKIAGKLGNDAKLGSLFHVKGIIYSSSGKTIESFSYYKKSEKIKLKVNDIPEIIRIQNGLGFAYFLAENYKQANLYFDKAIGYVAGQKDYKEMCITVFNCAQVSFFSMNYDNAVEYLEKTLSIIAIMKYKEIPFHSIAGINALLGVAFYKVGNLSKASEYYQKAKKSGVYLKIDEILYFNLLEIMLYGEKYDYEEIYKKYCYINNYIRETKIVHFYPFLSYETGMVLLKANRKEDAEKIFSEGLELSAEYEDNMYKTMLKRIMAGEKNISKPFSIKLRRIEIQPVIEYAEKVTMDNKLQKRVTEIDFLNNLQNLLVDTSMSIHIMAESYISLIKNYFFVDKCYIFFYENEKYELAFPYKEKNNVSADFLNELMQDKKDKIIIGNQSGLQCEFEYKSMIVSPLLTGREVEGAILFISEQSDIQFNEDEMYILGIGVKQFMLSLTNKRLQEKLKELALKDGLTSLYNHKNIFELLEKEINMALRFKKKLSIMMLDIDYFKNVNDTHGHQMGDSVLKKVAVAIKKSVRNVDMCGRYGGEEFMVILPESGLEDLATVAERVRKNVENLEIEKGIKVTISGGIAEYKPPQEAAQLVENADIKLYEAKRRGRNRIEF